MLSLDSENWANLHHAYGNALETPKKLRTLEDYPPCQNYESEPYFTLWSSLYHQCEIYSASYAALPHLIEICGRDPTKAHWSILHLAVQIELTRQSGDALQIPKGLEVGYIQAVDKLPSVSLDMLRNQDERNLISLAAAALAITKKEPKLAPAYLELDGDTVQAFLEWNENR